MSLDPALVKEVIRRVRISRLPKPPLVVPLQPAPPRLPVIEDVEPIELRRPAREAGRKPSARPDRRAGARPTRPKAAARSDRAAAAPVAGAPPPGPPPPPCPPPPPPVVPPGQPLGAGLDGALRRRLAAARARFEQRAELARGLERIGVSFGSAMVGGLGPAGTSALLLVVSAVAAWLLGGLWLGLRMYLLGVVALWAAVLPWGVRALQDLGAEEHPAETLRFDGFALDELNRDRRPDANALVDLKHGHPIYAYYKYSRHGALDDRSELLRSVSGIDPDETCLSVRLRVNGEILAQLTSPRLQTLLGAEDNIFASIVREAERIQSVNFDKYAFDSAVMHTATVAWILWRAQQRDELLRFVGAPRQ